MTVPAKRSLLLWKILGGCCALALVGLAAIWVWIGKSERQWQAYRKAALAEGQIIDRPPEASAISDAENFAAEPPFAAVVVGRNSEPAQAACLSTTGLPLEMLPELHRAKRADFASTRDNLRIPSETEEDVAREILRLCDERLAPEWSRVLAAEAKPKTRFGISHWPLPWPRVLPLLDLRTAAKIHALRAVARLRLGDGAGALGEVRGGLRLGEALDTEPGLLACMNRCKIVALQMHTVWEGLAQGAWSDADLAALEQDLAAIRVSASLARASDGERGWLNALCDALIHNPAETGASAPTN